MKRLTVFDRENLTILALLGGNSSDSDIPQRFLHSEPQLSRHKCIIIWSYNCRQNYYLTKKGWCVALRFCTPAQSKVYQSLKAIHDDYREPTNFPYGQEICHD